VLNESLTFVLDGWRKWLVHATAALLDRHAVIIVRVDEDVRGTGQGVANQFPIHLVRAKEPIQFDLSVLGRGHSLSPLVPWIHRNAKNPHPKKRMRADGIRYFVFVEGLGAGRVRTYATVPHRLMVSSVISAKV
jgi:hypothetical protein